MAISHRQLVLIGFAVVGIVTVGAVTGGFSEPLSAQEQSLETADVDFAVGDVDDSDQVLPGEDVTVWATVQNPESSERTRQVELRVDTDGDGVLDTTVAKQEVTLGADASRTVELTVQSEGMDPGTYTYGITTGDDDPLETNEFVVLRPATFTLDDSDASSPVVQGDSTTITATVTNDGETSGVQDVELYLTDGSGFGEDDLETSKSLSLGPSESGTVSFSVGTADRSPGWYRYELRTGDDERSGSLVVHQPATFEVTDVNGSLDVVRGETANVTWTVSNVGDVNGTQTVTFTHDGQALENRTLTLGARESADFQFSVDTATHTRGNYTYSLASTDHEASADLRVRESEFTVVELRGNDTLYIGDPMVFTATIQNTGDAPDTQSVELKIDIDGDDQPESYGLTQNVTLAANETKDVVFDVPYLEDPDPLPVEDFITGTFIYSVKTEDTAKNSVFVAKWPPYSGSGGADDDDTEDTSADIEYTTLDEISVAKTGHHYDELSGETTPQIEEIFARQPFADGLDITQVYTREEFARKVYDVPVPRSEDFEFSELDMDLQQKIEAEYDAQFLTEEGDTVESWDELAQAKHGTDYESLNDTEQAAIRDAYLAQFD
ncbi:hypothetical protein ACFQGE_17560 [Halomicroarcula sp. GCM10025817]|uniref:hypothetical protein n=1 Tax=Haloarcula TaxID=2237 RepID=UPI0023E8EDAB|nr:hypothetical protein [Halomicroarcula sp. SYNS111]